MRMVLGGPTARVENECLFLCAKEFCGIGEVHNNCVGSRREKFTGKVYVLKKAASPTATVAMPSRIYNVTLRACWTGINHKNTQRSTTTLANPVFHS